MTVQTVYIRGEIPPGDLRSIPQWAFADAAHLLDVDAVLFEQLVSELQHFGGFVDQAELARRFRPAVGGDDSKSKGIARFVDRYHELIRTHGQTVSQFVRIFLDGLKKADPNESIVPQKGIGELGRRIEQILTSYPGYLRQAKAEELAKKCGTPIEGIEIILDLRPVFDPNHTTIEGVIPVSRLRIVSTAFDGLPVLTEVVLSDRELDQLESLVAKAKTKLNVAKKAIAEGLRTPVPNTSLTESLKSEIK